MKTKLNITLAAIAAFTGSAFAGTAVVNTVVTPVAPEADFYRAGEFQGSVSFLGAARQGGGGIPLGGLGRGPAWTGNAVGGVDAELRYFFTRNFGIGLEGEWFDTRRSLFGSAMNFYLRAPLHQGSRWAPYLFAGVGGLYGPGRPTVEGHAGGGIEYRFTPNIGIFTDARYEWVDGSRNNIPQFGSMRLGLNFVF